MNMLCNIKFKQTIGLKKCQAAARAPTVRLGRRTTVRVVAVASPPSTTPQNAAGLEDTPSNRPVHPTPASAFLDLGVDHMLVEALPSIDVLRPSPIQAAVLPAVLSGANCAVQSYTGSGKTLSYLLPALTLALRRADALAADPSTPRRGGRPDVPIQVLVVAPSQELAMQIVRVAKSLLPPDVRRFAVQQVIGGANPKRQAEALASVPGPLVVVGTPGRLAEMVRSGSLRLHQCPLMILDEADQLLASAFAEDINHLSANCGKRLGPKSLPTDAAVPEVAQAAVPDGASARRQTVLVSATLTPSVLSRSARWCPEPRFVSAGSVPAVVGVGPDGEGKGPAAAKSPSWGWGVRGWDGPASPLAPKTRGSAGGVEGDELIPTMPPQLMHYYLVAEPRHKVDMLRRAIHALGVQRTLVFMNFQQRLQDTQFKLQARGMKAAALHGELPRLARSNLLNDFRRGRLRALVVSDVAARGIDVPACDAVFHLELPSSAAHYAHRAGRTGRLSAALAAQAAAEATAAEAEAAEGASGGGNGEGEGEEGAATSATTRAKAVGAADTLFVQAAGTVVTIVSPSERFVVDKLSQQLDLPLMEAHVTHGEFRLGSPPAGYSFEKDSGSDGARGEAALTAARLTGKKAAEGDKEQHQATAALASTRGRADDGKGTAAKQAKRAPADDAMVAAKPKAKKASEEEDKYEVLIDEDDDIPLEDDEDYGEDYEILDEDLEAFKNLRPAQVRQLAAAGAAASASAAASATATVAGIQLKGQRKPRVLPPGGDKDGASRSAGSSESEKGRGAGRVVAEGRGERVQPEGQGRKQAGERPRASTRAEVLEEVRRELEELRAEKEKAKWQQWHSGSGKRR